MAVSILGKQMLTFWGVIQGGRGIGGAGQRLYGPFSDLTLEDENERLLSQNRKEGREGKEWWNRLWVLEEQASLLMTGWPLTWGEVRGISVPLVWVGHVSLHAHQPFEPEWKWHVCECNKYLCISWSGSLSQRAKVLEITLTAVGRYPGLSQFKCDCLNGNCCFRC